MKRKVCISKVVDGWKSIHNNVLGVSPFSLQTLCRTQFFCNHFYSLKPDCHVIPISAHLRHLSHIVIYISSLDFYPLGHRPPTIFLQTLFYSFQTAWESSVSTAEYWHCVFFRNIFSFVTELKIRLRYSLQLSP